MRISTQHARIALLVLLVAIAGCRAPSAVHDWSTYTGPGEEHFQKEEIEFPAVRDPIEPFNRAIWNVNDKIVTYGVAPLATGYRSVVPRAVRAGIGNFFTNLLFPGRALNNLLQGKFGKAWEEAKRFGVNTTVGVLGFRDQASRWGIGKSNEDLGQTFAKWGWTDSTYFVLPFLGPSTVRDTFGFGADLLVDPTYYFPSAALVQNFNELSDEVLGMIRFMRTSYDPYELARLLYVMNRELDVDDYSSAGEASGATETLGVAFLKPRDEDFAQRAQTRHIVHPSTGRELAYNVWLQPEPAPVVYIIPGLGGHRLGGSAAAIAEAAFVNGNSAVTISSTMNFEFVASALSQDIPGFLPEDTHDVHLALDAIDADLNTTYPGRFTQRRLAGVSFGATTTLFIAAAEADPSNELIDFSVYLAVNSPVSFEHGVRQLDAFYNTPLVYPPEQRQEEIDAILRKTLDIAQGVLDPGEELPYTRIEAEFLIGLSFRNTVRDLIYQTQHRNNMGVLKSDLKRSRRYDAYREITQFSFMEYVYAFVLPYYAALRDDITLDEAGAHRLLELCDLRSISDQLRANAKVRFVSNRNDFLLRDEDIEWVTELLGEERVLFFERGGHLGNLTRDDIREAIHAEVLEVTQ